MSTRGPYQVIDGSPTEMADVLRRMTEEFTETLDTETAQTIRAGKTWDTKPIRIIDGNSQLIHAFGTKT